MSEADVKTLRSSYDALNRGDLDGALEMLDADAVWSESAELPGGDEFRGRAAVRAFLEGFLETWRDFGQEIEDAVVEGDRVALFLHLTAVGQTSGIEVDTRYAHVWTMRDGRGVRVDAYRDPEVALRELRGEGA